MLKLSIIIISWNGKDLLDGCLRSLIPILQRGDVEIVVVDNGSEDGTSQFVTERYPSVRLRSLSRNFGVAYARNRGLESARGEYLWLLDNDTEVNESAVRGLISYLDANPKCGLCGCRLLDSDGKVQASPKPFPGIKEKVANLLCRKGYRYPYSKKVMDSSFEPDYLIGACQMFRREVYERVGALDEKIFYGPEDADFCLRIKKAGWKVVFLPDFSILHRCQRASWHRLFSPLAREHVKGLFHFYCKHKRFF